jgi:hypothetical protein
MANDDVSLLYNKFKTMLHEKIGLTKEVLGRIKSDADLWAGICKILNISPSSIQTLLFKNDARLTQASVLEFLKNELGVQSTDYLLHKQIISGKNEKSVCS